MVSKSKHYHNNVIAKGPAVLWLANWILYSKAVGSITIFTIYAQGSLFNFDT